MIKKDIVKQIAAEWVEGTDNYLVDVSVAPDNIITIEIDNDRSVSIDDCVELSRFVESRLNREEEDFELEVGSSGVTTPFKVLRQYAKNIGNEVEMALKSGAKLTGVLKAADENEATITLEKKVKTEGSKRKAIVTEDQTYSYDEIKYTKYLIRF
jgi:ribosome maturation factor RimP